MSFAGFNSSPSVKGRLQAALYSMRKKNRIRRQGGAGGAGAFTPLSIYPTGEAGLWYKSADLSTQYQESTGITPVTAVEQPDGLVLDKRLGAERGPELLTNSDFNAGATGWATHSGGTISVSGGVARVSDPAGGGVYAGIDQIAYATLGGWFEVEMVVNGVSADTNGYIVCTNGGASQFGPQCLFESTNTYPKTVRFIARSEAVGNNNGIYIQTFLRNAGGGNSNPGCWMDIEKISVKELPGNHASQANSATRPTLSARVNTLLKTEDFSDAAWVKGGMTVARTTDPNGGNNAWTLTVIDGYAALSQAGTITSAGRVRFSVKAGTLTTADFTCYSAGPGDQATAVRIISGPGAVSVSAGRVSMSGLSTSVWTVVEVDVSGAGSFYFYPFAAGSPNASGTIHLAFPDARSGDFDVLPYQRVNTATDYDTTGFLHYFKFDGADDGFSTATFAAGTLTSNMDCFMLVRKDSAANAVFASDGPSGASFFAVTASGFGDAAHNTAGTPTYLVDGVTVLGTRGALHTALTLGLWHVLEVRNLDLSTWTQFTVGSYSAFMINAGISEAILAPAQDADTRTTIREYLAAQGGITL